MSCHLSPEGREERRAAGARADRSAELRIGDHVTYDGRVYVVLGLEPMSVPGRRVDLEDVETGERRRVPLLELEDPGD